MITIGSIQRDRLGHTFAKPFREEVGLIAMAMG
jgi:hypothetical protein